MFKFFRRLQIEWRVLRFNNLLKQHAQVKDRLVELTGDRGNTDQTHIVRIVEYTRLLCKYERELGKYGYTP